MREGEEGEEGKVRVEVEDVEEKEEKEEEEEDGEGGKAEESNDNNGISPTPIPKPCPCRGEPTTSATREGDPELESEMYPDPAVFPASTSNASKARVVVERVREQPMKT